MKAEEVKTEKNIIKYNIFQICNLFKLTGVLRKHMLFKYKKSEVFTKKEWEKIFKKENIDF